VAARDKYSQNLKSLLPAEVSYGAKYSIIANDFPSLIQYIPAATCRLFFVKYTM
jgi:hypothetical protein